MPTNLEYYRKQAKALRKAAQAGDPTARERISRCSPHDAAAPQLAHAQLAIAREQGYPSWPRLRAAIEQSTVDERERAETFVRAAVSEGRRAQELLASHPRWPPPASTPPWCSATPPA